MKLQSIINRAVQEAAKANHKVHSLASIICKGSVILGIGHNKDAIHAESFALHRAYRSNVRGATMYVVRVRSNGKLALAYPCSSCMASIIDSGIRKIVYSTNEGTLQSARIDSKMFKIKPKTVLWGNSDVTIFSKIAIVSSMD